MSSDIPSPGSIPRNCDATYRGNLGNKPERRQTRSGGEIVRARLAVNMAASSIPAEERDRFTEWLTVVCFAPAQMDRLERCEKGELITVNGPVTWREYTPDAEGNRASSTPSSASTFGAHPPRCRPTPAALRTRTRGTCPCDGSRPRNGGGPFRAAAKAASRIRMPSARAQSTAARTIARKASRATDRVLNSPHPEEIAPIRLVDLRSQQPYGCCSRNAEASGDAAGTACDCRQTLESGRERVARDPRTARNPARAVLELNASDLMYVRPPGSTVRSARSAVAATAPSARPASRCRRPIRASR